MDEHTYAVDSEVVIKVTAHKNLILQGDAVSHVRLAGQGAAQATWEAKDDHFVLEASRDIEVTLPLAAQVELANVGGHCEARDLNHGLSGDTLGGHGRFRRIGSLAVHHIGGHLHVTDCRGHVQVRQVGGHLHLDRCQGDVRIDQVGGHVKGSHIDGACHLPSIGGHAQLEHVQQELRMDAGGHVRVSINPQGEQSYDIRSGGRLACHIPPHAHAKIEMDSPTLGHDDDGSRFRTLGDGTAQVRLRAGAQIALVETDPNQPGPDPDRVEDETVRDSQWAVEGMAQQIRTSVHQALGQVSEKINQALTDHGLDSQQREDLQTQFKDISRDAMESVRETAENVQSQTRNIWKNEVKPNLFSSSDPDASPDSDPNAVAEERKMILRMLSEGKITVDEANELLKTLNQ